MATSVKITIIGAGSTTFSGRIINDLCMMPLLKGSHVTLMDIDPIRLQEVTEVARRVTEERNSDIDFDCTLDRREALKGADFVINTALIGKQEWVEKLTLMQEKHGYYRNARFEWFGQMKFFLDVARDMEEICPDAWLIMSANPVFEGCTFLTRESRIKVIGLCHGHHGCKKVAKTLGLEPELCTFQSQGFNHWIWMTDFRYKGKDAYPILDEWIEKHSEEYWAENPKEGDVTFGQMSRAAIHQYKYYGFMPIGDTVRFGGWWYVKDLDTRIKWFGKYGSFDSDIAWPLVLKHLDERYHEMIKVVRNRNNSIDRIFKHELSGEQIIPIINSLANDIEGIYQVNIPNSGQLIKGFPENLIVEVQAVINGCGVRGVSVPAFPQKLYVEAMIPRWHRCEMRVAAMQTQDKDILLAYLLNDHRTRSLEQAQSLLDEFFSHPDCSDLNKYFNISGNNKRF